MAKKNKYDVGDLVRVYADKFTDPFDNDKAIDPDAVSVTVTAPDGTATTYTYAADQVKQESEGVYYYEINVDQNGWWNYRWFSTGEGQAAEKWLFYARAI